MGIPYAAQNEAPVWSQLKKQFETAFAENAKGTLDFLQVGTFNEHIAQPQKNNFQSWVKSMGLEGDSMGSSLWVSRHATLLYHLGCIFLTMAAISLTRYRYHLGCTF